MRKVVTTYGHDGKENGWLMEIEKDGDKTTAYATAIKPGSFKGSHLHRIRTANYICVTGNVLVVLYDYIDKKWVKREIPMTKGGELHIPINIPTAIYNVGSVEAIILNFPVPAYDPNVNEQVEYTEEDIKNNVLK